MQAISLPARRALITAIIVILLLYGGYAYVAIAVVAVFILSWFFFPVKQPKDFFAGVIPAIDALTDYVRNLIEAIRQPDLLENDLLLPAEHVVIKSFLPSHSTYPEWVYRAGFNPGLRSGFRYFLIQLEHALDVCFSLTYWLSQPNVLADQGELAQLMCASLKINIDLLAGLSRTMQHHADKTLRPTNDVVVDLVSDVVALEGALQRLVPPSIELLDMSAEYVTATALVRDVKDLREVLLLLVAAVPG